MKIYSILFDTVPQHPKIEEFFKSRNLHYSDFITNSCTVNTLVSFFSGKTPSEMRDTGIGHSHTYALLSKEEQLEWDKNIIFNDLPDNWKIHIHAMPTTRGDNDTSCWPMYPNQDCRLIPDDICGRDRDFIFYDYIKGTDEKEFIQKMQKLPSDENHFIVLKYNHFHDRDRGKHEEVVDLFIDILNTINFEEENSLFWIFADHGLPDTIDTLMSPPGSWLSWASVTDNITKKKVIKNKIYVLDFKNTVLNRIYNKNLPNDVLSEVDKNRIYVVEDGRSAVDEYNCSTVSAIKCLGDNKFIQFIQHTPRAAKKVYTNNKSRTIIYDKFESHEAGDFILSYDYTLTEPDTELINHLKLGPWNWYFE